MARLAEAIVLGSGFEPQMSVSLATERSVVCVITISYDRDVPGEDARALECYRRLAETLMEHGYPPYRLNVGAMDLAAGDDAYDAAVIALRDALDPRGILSPGRYEPIRQPVGAGSSGLGVVQAGGGRGLSLIGVSRD